MLLKSLAQNLIERRANRISDPVARLRYLQRRIPIFPASPKPRRKGPVVVFALMLASLLIAYKPSKTEARESFAPLPRVTAAGADVFANV